MMVEGHLRIGGFPIYIYICDCIVRSVPYYCFASLILHKSTNKKQCIQESVKLSIAFILLTYMNFLLAKQNIKETDM